MNCGSWCKGIGVSLVILAVTNASIPAQGAGFGLRESASASAFASANSGGTAGAEDISYMFFNPAGLTRHSGTQYLIGAQAIFPELEFKGGTATTVLTGPITGVPHNDDAGVNALAPSLYGMWSLDADTRIGLGVTIPWGLETDHPSGWIGRYHALNSKLVSLNFNPVIARRFGALSVGGGVQFQYTDVELSNAADFGTVGALLAVGGSVPGTQDGKAEFEGSDWGLGFNLGILYEFSKRTRVGLSYRSMISHDLDGDTDFTLDSAGIGAAISAGPLPGAFVDTGSRAKLTTPETLSLGIHHDVNARWSVMADVVWTAWSRFQEFRITFDNPAQADDVTTALWNDTYFFSVGTAFRANPAWTLRGGIALDQTPVRDSTRNPRIPDEDRLWVSVGATYHGFKGVRISAAYTHFFINDAAVGLTTSIPGNTFRGNLSGDFSLTSDLFSVQAAFTF
jgi:long-chain fatty acid transport protein